MMKTSERQTFTPLTLPCGVILKNRMAKSAMSEILGTSLHAPSKELIHVYRRWAKGGTGLLITGNVMVDSKALGEPNNVVMEDERFIKELSEWADAGKENQTHIWVQLNHPGKQSPAFLTPEPVSPSAIPLSGALEKAFRPPRELTHKEILAIIDRFVFSAELAKKCGFTGVQIHGAHGYLVAQFLSPLHNQRSDQWGGNTQNRMRFLLEMYKKMRERLGENFPISIKMNSSDFQKGGLEEEEALEIMRTLSDAGMDLIEISGGNYEKPVMMVGSKKNSREAYFLEFSKKVMSLNLRSKIMLTGGLRSAQIIEESLQEGAMDLAGLARPLTVEPDLPLKMMEDPSYKSFDRKLTTGLKSLDRMGMLNITWYENQIITLGKGKKPDPNLNVYVSLLKTFFHLGIGAFQQRRAR